MGTEHVPVFHVMSLSPPLLGCVPLFGFYSDYFCGTEPSCPVLPPILSEDCFFQCNLYGTSQVPGTAVVSEPGSHRGAGAAHQTESRDIVPARPRAPGAQTCFALFGLPARGRGQPAPQQGFGEGPGNGCVPHREPDSGPGWHRLLLDRGRRHFPGVSSRTLLRPEW